MDPGVISDVSDTAIWVAHYRVQESERPDALFHDPLAKLLVGDRGAQIAKRFGPTGKYTAWSVVSRTILIDDFINADGKPRRQSEKDNRPCGEVGG